MLDALSYRFHGVSVQNISVFRDERRILLNFIIHLTLQKINPVSFGVISDRMTNGTKIKDLRKKKFLQNKDWRKITRVKRNYDLVRQNNDDNNNLIPKNIL